MRAVLPALYSYRSGQRYSTRKTSFQVVDWPLQQNVNAWGLLNAYGRRDHIQYQGNRMVSAYHVSQCWCRCWHWGCQSRLDPGLFSPTLDPGDVSSTFWWIATMQTRRLVCSSFTRGITSFTFALTHRGSNKRQAYFSLISSLIHYDYNQSKIIW